MIVLSRSLAGFGDQRDAHQRLVMKRPFHPDAVIAEQLAVVAGEDDERVIG
jgi:hypothetical protein